MTELCDLAAVELRRLIGVKSISPVELLESCIGRIEAVNPAVNAAVALCAERARAEARRAEQAVMAGQELGLLHGLPVGIKDLNETEGLRTTFGSPLYKDYIPERDDRVVAAIRAAGGIVLCKTNTPEFGSGGTTFNDVYGTTGNPFDPTLISGGSSGGSAVAVATGMVPIAPGTDFGASLRNPAGFCGVVGMRPTRGTVPYAIQSPAGLPPFSVQGPMARSVADAALLLSAMVGDEPRDPFSRKPDPALLEPPAFTDLSSLRIATSETLGVAPVDAAIRAVFRERTQRFASAFAACREQDPDLGPVHEIYEILRGVLYVGAYRQHFDEHPERLGRNVRDNIERGLKYSAADVAWAQAELTAIFGRVLSFFEEFDFLICPANSVSPFPRDQTYPRQINGQELALYTSWTAITYALSITSHPVAVIPCGVDRQGLPFGIQIVAPFRRDRQLVNMAHSLERLFAGDPDLRRVQPDIKALSSA